MQPLTREGVVIALAGYSAATPVLAALIDRVREGEGAFRSHSIPIYSFVSTYAQRAENLERKGVAVIGFGDLLRQLDPHSRDVIEMFVVRLTDWLVVGALVPGRSELLGIAAAQAKSIQGDEAFEPG